MKYFYIYQHNNGAYVYEATEGSKVYNYNWQWYQTMSEVNSYVNASGVNLKRKNHNLQTKQHDLSKVDWLIKIEEYRNIKFK